MNEKIKSGSSRDKTAPTPKQDKWKDPFYRQARTVRVKAVSRVPQKKSVKPLSAKHGFFKKMQNGFDRLMKNKARVKV